MDYSPPGYLIHGIFQARVLEWGAIALLFTNKCIAKYLEKETATPSSFLD